MKRKDWLIAGVAVVVFCFGMYYIYNTHPRKIMTDAQIAGILKDISVDIGNKNFDRALKIVDAAIKKDKKNKSLFFYRAQILFASGRYEDAIAAAEKAIKLDASFQEAYGLKGEALLSLKKYKEAGVFFRGMSAGTKGAAAGALYYAALADILDDNLHNVMQELKQYASAAGSIPADQNARLSEALEKSTDKEKAAQIKAFIDEKLPKS